MDYESLKYPYFNLFFDINNHDNLHEIYNKVKQLKDIEKIYTKIPKGLSKYSDSFEKFGSEYFIIHDLYDETHFINNLTDIFSEKERVNCSIGKYESPQHYWDKNKKHIIKKTINKYKDLNIYLLRETIFENTKLCNNFRISVCLSILNYFKPKKWLDISAGWGDRLMSAIMYSTILKHPFTLYEATDPNLNLHPCYQEMLNTFVSPSKQKKFIIHKNGFLEANLSNTKFDIVFSSPPYFTLEKYSSFAEDSITKHPNEKDWVDYFLVPSIIKSHKYLKKGGHLILYYAGSKYAMERLFKISNELMEYQGIIYYFENKMKYYY